MGISLALSAYTPDDLQILIAGETAQGKLTAQVEYDLDKIWYDLHYLLTHSCEPQDTLLSNALYLPHNPLDDMGLDEEEIESLIKEMGAPPVAYLLEEEVAAVAAELDRQDFEKLWENTRTELANDDDDKEWLQEAFVKLRAFYRNAADNCHSVLGMLY